MGDSMERCRVEKRSVLHGIDSAEKSRLSVTKSNKRPLESCFLAKNYISTFIISC